MSKLKKVASIAAGVGLGVGIGILVAPKSGKETRKELMVKFEELKKEIKNIDYKKVKDDMAKKIKELQKELENLDKEKILEIAKVKAEDIKKKSEELYKEAIKQGKPAVEKAAREVKDKTIDVLNGIIKKLQEDDSKTKKTTKKN